MTTQLKALKEAIQEKACGNKEFVILKADRYANDNSDINIRLFVGENLEVGPFNNFKMLDNFVKEAVGDTGILVINDISIIVADWYDFTYCWKPHPPKKLHYDVFSDNVSQTYLFNNLIDTYAEESFTVNEMINKISEYSKSLQDRQAIASYNKESSPIPDNTITEPLFIYSQLLYYVVTEPKFDVEDMNKKHVKIYYK